MVICAGTEILLHHDIGSNPIPTGFHNSEVNSYWLQLTKLSDLLKFRSISGVLELKSFLSSIEVLVCFLILIFNFNF